MRHSVNSADVAALAGVSRATVSYVVNGTRGRRIPDSTRQRVLAAAEQLGYVPDSAARALRSGKTSVALLHYDYPTSTDVGTVIQLSAVGEMLQAALARGLHDAGKTLLLWCDTSKPPDAALRSLTPCIVVAPVGLPATSRSAFEAAGVPIVTLEPALFGSPGEPRTVSWIAGWNQADHLASRGHTRIGYVSPVSHGFGSMANDRVAGASARCVEIGLAAPQVFGLPIEEQPTSPALENQLLSWVHDGVTAVACFNDIVAARTLQAARSLGLAVPGKVAVIGCDNDVIAALGDPPLTSVRFDVEGMARDLVDQSLAALESRPAPTSRGTHVAVVVRATT